MPTKKALALDPDYDLAMFNLGGVSLETAVIGSKRYSLGEERWSNIPIMKLTARLRSELSLTF